MICIASLLNLLWDCRHRATRAGGVGSGQVGTGSGICFLRPETTRFGYTTSCNFSQNRFAQARVKGWAKFIEIDE